MLVILLGAVGLAAMVGWLDVILLPALAFFIGLTLYAVWRRQKRRAIQLQRE
ncbi:MAG: mercury resistance system transport protein MerF [Hyphomicrobium sp.]